jgi:hypothetical protein
VKETTMIVDKQNPNTQLGSLRATLFTLLRSQEQCSEEYDALCLACWHALSSEAKETLFALVKEGPLFDGDVPSKSGRDELLEHGLATKCVVKGEQGFQAANYLGWAVAQTRELYTLVKS